MKKRAGDKQRSRPARELEQQRPENREPGWRSFFRTIFEIDPRSLALFRVAIGVLLLLDLWIRATDLQAMYTDAGMFPRALICHHFTTVWNWSFHFGSGSWGFQAVLFGLVATLAVALLLGIETRVATIGSWLMLVSLQHRVPPILSGADILLRMLLFWAMFLPLDRAWSVDRWLKRRQGLPLSRDDSPVVSVASGAILLQMALMYLFSAIFKSNAAWFRGEAVAGSLTYNFYASPLGTSLLHYPKLLMVMSWGTFALEWTAPVMLFLPWSTPRVRLCLIAALATMHICIGLCMEVDMFSPVSITGLLLFLPAEFWNSRMFARVPWFAKGVSEATKAARPGVVRGISINTIAQGMCALLLLYVVVNNINSLPGHPLTSDPPVRKGFFWTGFGLAQKWSMFDEPPSKNGWYVAWGKLRDGSEVDLLRHGANLDWGKPEFPAGVYRNYRWRKLFREMTYEDELGFQVFRRPVAEFLCRDWNTRHEAARQVVEFNLVYCNEVDAKSIAQGPQSSAPREGFVHLGGSELISGDIGDL